MIANRLAWIVDPLILRFHQRARRLAEQKRLADTRSQAALDDTATVHPEAVIHNHLGRVAAIQVGAHTHIRGELRVFWNAGAIRLGRWCYVGEGTRIWSQASVIVEDHVLISHMVDIHDTDSHPKSWDERRLDAQGLLSGAGYRTPTMTASEPVHIEADAWIGFKATILKGVRVGRGAIVASSSVVTKSVAPWTVVAGNPAVEVATLLPP